MSKTRRERNQEYYSAYPEKFRGYHLKDKYGITVEQYDAMLEDQGGVCAICGRPPARRRLSVDHNHRTGRVRGLLCDHCNTAIGMFADDEGLLESALSYLQRWTP